MKNLTDDLKTKWHPEAVIVAYKSSGYGSARYFLESRKVDREGNLGEGKPVSKKFVDSIVKTFSASFSSTPHGVIPSTMLYIDDRPGHCHYLWYNKPAKRNMTFVKGLSIEDGEYAVPGILYEVRDTSLFVYAFKGSKPSTRRKLYRYPSFNLYDDQRVCLGNAKVEKPTDATWHSLVRYWETMYWGSTNSHLIGGSPVKGNLGLAIKNSKESFDTSILTPVKVTLKDLMK